jgi:hypothetical protein
MFDRLRRLLQSPRPVNSADEFRVDLSERAAYISQKCIIEFSRMKTHVNWDLLIKDEVFVDILKKSQWDGYAAVLVDLAVVAEGLFRDHVGTDNRVFADWLVDSVAAALDSYPRPAHRPDGWQDILDLTREQIAKARLAAPKPAHEVARRSGTQIFHDLPLQELVRIDDLSIVRNNVRMAVGRARDDWDRLVDRQAVLAGIEGIGAAA